MIIIITILCLIIFWLVFEFLAAPAGSEDDKGFHKEIPVKQNYVNSTEREKISVKKDEDEKELALPIIT
jgi:hypothetical protein